MVVLRETLSAAPRKAEALEYMGKGKAKFPDGHEVEVDLAHYAYLGDMHIRFVFDGPTSMVNASLQDLIRLKLEPNGALELAVANLRRVYGPPMVIPWTAGLMQLESKSPDLNTSFFLDKKFWSELAKSHPEGIVAAVPKRGALLFAPLSDTEAVGGLRKGIAFLHTSSESLGLSSALYLFKDGNWTLFQEPATRQ